MKKFYNISASPGAGNNFIENLIIDIETQSSIPFIIDEELGHCHGSQGLYKNKPNLYQDFETSLHNDFYLVDPEKYIKFGISFTKDQYIRIECNHWYKYVRWIWDREFVSNFPNIDDKYWTTVTNLFPDRNFNKLTELSDDEVRQVLLWLESKFANNDIGRIFPGSIELKYYDILHNPEKIITILENQIEKQATPQTYVSYHKYLQLQDKLKSKYFPWCYN